MRQVPLLGQIFAQRRDQNQKTELVIFLKTTVIRDPSVEGDYANFRSLLPGSDFFRKPNPQKGAPSGPSWESLR
jgi:MSHA biogenesis protein MshL